jgi:curved DNA-binding protein CbpA
VVKKMLNYYDILGIERNSSFKAVKDSFRSKAKRIHPDVSSGNKSSAEEKMRLLLLAYSVLSSPVKRKAYDREYFSLAKISRFNYREYLKNQAADLYAQCKLIFYDILNGFNEEALQIYENLSSHSDFQLDKYLDDGDYRDCLFLLAEEFQNQKRYIKAFFLFKELIIAEAERPYFHHFIDEVIDRLRYLVASKIQKQKSKNWCILQINHLLSLNIPNKDKAFFCKKIAEIYHGLGQKQYAIDYFELALQFDRRISGTKKLIEKIGFDRKIRLNKTTLDVQ